MDDEMDFYLSRCIKNWAARYQPPVDGRERLIQAASKSSSMGMRSGYMVKVMTFLKTLFFGQPVLDLRGVLLAEPYSQTHIWSFDTATNWRLAN